MKKSDLVANTLQGFMFGLTETRNEGDTLSEDELSALSWAYTHAKPYLTKEQELGFCESVISWCDTRDSSGLNFFIRIMLGHETRS